MDIGEVGVETDVIMQRPLQFFQLTQQYQEFLYVL